jgi:Concanavalin A-like lectin/glucanases superfamily
MNTLSSVKSGCKFYPVSPQVTGYNLKLSFGVTASPATGTYDDTGKNLMSFVFQAAPKLNVYDSIRGYVLSGGVTATNIQFQNNYITRITLTRVAWIKITGTSPDGIKIINSPSVDLYVSGTSTISASIRGSSVTDPYGNRGLNIWVHTAMTYNGSVLKLFVNGLQVASTVPVLLYVGIDSSVNIMATRNSSYLPGHIDNVLCYPFVLSPIQIKGLYDYETLNPML